jgi:CubicO group peptidase (beta-lactamase class C family)
VVPAAWIDDISTRGDADAWARSELADVFPNASYRSQWYRIDRDKGVLVAFGIHGQWIYIHPDAELVIIRMASESTPLDPDRVRGWRRGFDAIAARFLTDERAAIATSKAAAARGEFATDEQVRTTWAKHGL